MPAQVMGMCWSTGGSRQLLRPKWPGSGQARPLPPARQTSRRVAQLTPNQKTAAAWPSRLVAGLQQAVLVAQAMAPCTRRAA